MLLINCLNQEVFMVRQHKKSIFGVLTCLAFLLAVFGGMSFSFAQEKKADTEKLYNEIAGKYEFEYESQIFTFVISVIEGNLVGAPEGEVQEPLEPVEDEDMTFMGYDPEGREHQFKFARDDDGKITKCTLTVPYMGVIVDGEKIKNKS